MSSKINGSYGTNNVYGQSETKKERTSSAKNFGEFYVGDQEDDLDPQAQSAEEGEESEDLSSIFGNFGSSKSDSDNRSNPSSRSSNNKNQKIDNDTYKPQYKAQYKAQHKPDFDKPDFDKSAKFQEGEEPEKLKELIKIDPLPSFQVPMQIDRVFSPTPIQPTTVIPTQVMEDIVQDVRLGVNEMGAAEFQFDLKSDTLDGLKLKISTQDGQVYATFIAENVHVKDTIDQGAQELIRALQDKGLQVANIQVSVGGDSSNSGGNNGGNHGGNNGGQSQSDQQNQLYNGYSYAESKASSTSNIDINANNTDYTV